MEKKIKIPKGYRRLRKGEITCPKDKVFRLDLNRFGPRTLPHVQVPAGPHCDKWSAVYIRRIKRSKPTTQNETEKV
jgi:hypothetical protein